LTLLFGTSAGALRVAVILTVVAMSLVAVSIALQPSIELFRADIEERVLDEVELVREHARADVAVATRNTQYALASRLGALTETVESLQAQVDQLQDMAQLPAIGPGSRAGPSGGSGRVRRTETVHVTRRTTTVEPGEEGRGAVYGSRRGAVEGEWHERGSAGAGMEDGWAHDDQWDGVAGGERWAAVRADERGRELRMGQRRSSVSRDGHGGGEYRVEDRWASVTRDDPDGDWRQDDARAALPAAHGEPPSRYVDEPEHDYRRDREDHRSRDDYGGYDQDDVRGGYEHGPSEVARPAAEPRRRNPYEDNLVLDVLNQDDQRDRHRDDRVPDPRRSEPAYPDPRHMDPRHPDPRHGDPRYADPRYADPRYADPRYRDPRYADPRYRDPRPPRQRPAPDHDRHRRQP
jgi:hypothetical protein